MFYLYSSIVGALKMNESPIDRKLLSAVGFLSFYFIEVYSICSITNSAQKSVNQKLFLIRSNSLKRNIWIRKWKDSTHSDCIAQLRSNKREGTVPRKGKLKHRKACICFWLKLISDCHILFANASPSNRQQSVRPVCDWQTNIFCGKNQTYFVPIPIMACSS